MNHQSETLESAEMTKYGIVCRPVDYFHLGEYRYTSLKDALAAGRRQQEPSEKPDLGKAQPAPRH